MFVLMDDGSTIMMHRGNTGTVRITLTGYTFAASDRLVFRLVDMAGKVIKEAVCAITGGVAEVAFANSDTDSADPGLYRWGVTVVTDPDYDSGKVVDGSAVCTPVCDGLLKLLDTAALV